MMNVAVYSAHYFEENYLTVANMGKHTFQLGPTYLRNDTASMCAGFDAVPYTAAEHTQAWMLVLNRKLIYAHNRRGSAESCWPRNMVPTSRLVEDLSMEITRTDLVDTREVAQLLMKGKIG